MEIFLVGGAVRDHLLGLTVSEKDWLVVGATIDEMLAQGYTTVGKDFPVFLHPQSHEEYALARTERKSGSGHKGFTIHATPDVTIEEDLKRRDLTINAIAQQQDGTLIDPYGGQADIENKILRHISDAFAEDPLRVLRVARFAAKLHQFKFRVAPETLELMTSLSQSGELQNLPAERIWQETHKALLTDHPAIFFEVLQQCQALSVLMPELDKLFGVPQTEKYHPEIDTGVHSLMSLQQASKLSKDTRIRFAAVIHDLGKAETPVDALPRHIGHEKKSLPLIKNLCKRLSVPNDHRDLALVAAEYHTHCHRGEELRAETIYKVLKACRALQDDRQLMSFLQVCEADARGRSGLENRAYTQPLRFIKALQACKGVSVDELRQEGLEGPALGRAIEKKHIEAIAAAVPKTNREIEVR